MPTLRRQARLQLQVQETHDHHTHTDHFNHHVIVHDQLVKMIMNSLKTASEPVACSVLKGGRFSVT